MAEAKQVTRWITFDGRDFGTEAEAKAHEEDHFQVALVGLTAEQVAAAVAWAPEARAISDALERAGGLVARTRLAAGFRKRARNGSAAAVGDDAAGAATEPEDSPPPADPDDLP